MSNLSGIIGSGQTDGRTHPLGVSSSMSCPLSESPKILIFSNTWAAKNGSARRPRNHERPSMVRRNKNAASRPPFEGDGVAAMDHSKSLPLASACVGSQTQSAPSFPSFILPLQLRLGHSLSLSFQHHLAFKLADRGQEVQHQPSGRRRRINPHREDSKAHAFLFQPVDDRHQVGYGSGQPADLVTTKESPSWRRR